MEDSRHKKKISIKLSGTFINSEKNVKLFAYIPWFPKVEVIAFV